MAPNATASTSSIASSSSTIGRISPPPPVVMGFTPINAPRSSALQASGVAPPSDERSTNASASQRNGQSDQAKSIVSEYLGRGDDDISIPAAAQTTRVTRASAAKEKNAVTQKRAATTNNTPSQKRRKTSDISDSMPVAKPKQTKGKAKAKAAKQTEANPPAEVANALSSQPVSLYSSATSMETLSVPSQQTSFDAAKASKFGTTLYHGSQVARGAPSSSLVSQPWFEAHFDQTKADAISTGNGAATRRGQANVKAMSDPRNRGPQKIISKAASSRTLSDEFMPADGLEDDPALLDFIEAVTQKTMEMTPGTTSQAAVRQRKPKESTAGKPLKTSSIPAMGSSRTLSEDFLVGDDADMDEVLNVTMVASANVESQADDKEAPSKLRKGSGTIEGNATKGRKSAKSKTSNHDVDVVLTEEQNLAANGEDDPPEDTATPLARQWKLNMREVDENEDYGGAMFSEAERKILGTVIRESYSLASPLIPPATDIPSTDSSTDSLKADSDNAIKPIVRNPFPRPILDRSPIFGASPGTTLRTCFRIGEALKEGIAAIRANNNTVIELYARVKSSHREGRKQHFVFHDLYHTRPPYLEGTCEVWNQSRLWELDTRSFLSAQKTPAGVMCRAIARLKRKDVVAGKVKGWRLEVLSIWEAAWEDIDFIAGIYGKERDEAAVADDDD